MAYLEPHCLAFHGWCQALWIVIAQHLNLPSLLSLVCIKPEVSSFCLFIPFMGFSRQQYWSGLPFPSPVHHVLSELSIHALPAWLIISLLDNAVVHVISLISFLWLCFSFCLLSYSYTVEVTNRFKGLDLIECLKNYGQRFMTLYTRKWSRPSPRKRNVKRQNGCLTRPYKWLRKEEKQKVKEKRKDIPIWMQSSKEQQGEIRKPSSVINAKK